MSSQSKYGSSALSKSLNSSLFGIPASLPDGWAQVSISLSTLPTHSPVALRLLSVMAGGTGPKPAVCSALTNSQSHASAVLSFLPHPTLSDQSQHPRVILKEAGAHRGSIWPK